MFGVGEADSLPSGLDESSQIACEPVEGERHGPRGSVVAGRRSLSRKRV